ncbi:hypothetical protein ACFX58_17725 [Sphingomonas sp. NCPPB 2930]
MTPHGSRRVRLFLRLPHGGPCLLAGAEIHQREQRQARGAQPDGAAPLGQVDDGGPSITTAPWMAIN